MSAGLKDLMEYIRQHPCFQELLNGVDMPELKAWRPSKAGETQAQESEWIYRSGCRAQHDRWRAYLIDHQPSAQE